MFGKYYILSSARDQRERSENTDLCLCATWQFQNHFYPENTFPKEAMSTPGNRDSAEMYFTGYCLRPGLTSLRMRYLNLKKKKILEELMPRCLGQLTLQFGRRVTDRGERLVEALGNETVRTPRSCSRGEELLPRHTECQENISWR